jgi:hypothetical protein
MQAVKIHKSPSQLKGERYLRDKNLLVPTSVLRNTERVKYKARALRLKEEYKHKYLTKKRSAVRQASRNILVAPAVPENLIIALDYFESTPSRLRRAATFCMQLWFSFLAAIVICVLLGYSLRYFLSTYKV